MQNVNSIDVTFLSRSCGDWVNEKYPTIVPLAAEAINTIDEGNELDVPNLIPPDYGHFNESNDDDCDDDIGQGDDLQIPVAFILKHRNYESDD